MADTQQLVVWKQSATDTTPEIMSAATALATNNRRAAWQIQNLGTNALLVNLGGSASITSFHFILKGGTGNDDGNGGTFSQDRVVYTGTVTIAGTSPRYTVLEIQ